MSEIIKQSDYNNCVDCDASFYVGTFNRQENRCATCQKLKTLEHEAKQMSLIEKYKLESVGYVEAQVFSLIKQKKLVFFFRWVFVWFIIGASYAFYNRTETKSSGCIYRSIGSFINPGYLLGCEIFRERWEIGK